jgi:hypothetical protein
VRRPISCSPCARGNVGLEPPLKCEVGVVPDARSDYDDDFLGEKEPGYAGNRSPSSSVGGNVSDGGDSLQRERSSMKYWRRSRNSYVSLDRVERWLWV